jgi:hypothetical protein
MFRPGQRVECIVERPRWKGLTVFGQVYSPDEAPRRGAVCEVVEVVGFWGWDFLLLVGYGQVGFSADGFRPIVEDGLERLREIAENPWPRTPYPNDERELVVDFGDPERTLCVRGVPQGEKGAEAEHV